MFVNENIMYHFPHFVLVTGHTPPHSLNRLTWILCYSSSQAAAWLTRQHLHSVTYHNRFWLHVCPSCHTESQTWAFFFIQDYEANIFFVQVKRNINQYISCATVRKFWTHPPHSTVELVTANLDGSLGTSTRYWEWRAHLKNPAFLLCGAYAEFQGSIL